MNNTYAIKLQERDLENFAWSSLRQYHHVPSVTSTLMKIHRVPEKFRSDVAKQANQVRYCLIQAKEFRDAGRAVTLSTRPVLYYYSIMNLALAQVLFNLDGNSSLDRARGEHAHHGLLFTAGDPGKNQHTLEVNARLLRARPMSDARGKRRGTFELWCKQSQEDSLAGSHIRSNGALTQNSLEILMAATDCGFCKLEDNGISLLDCFEALPMLRTNTYHSSKTIRARLSRTSDLANGSMSLVVHPHHPNSDIDAVANAFAFSPHLVNEMDVQEGASGFIFSLRDDRDHRRHVYFPPACTWTEDEFRFLPPGRAMNEFGYIYLALYILGNYARYYPDRWMADVEQGTPLSLLSDQLISLADARMSILTLSDLSGVLYVSS